MAARLQKIGTDETITSQHNAKHRGEVIVASIARLYAIDEAIAKLSKKHLSDLRAEKSDIKKRLREDFQMPATLIAARYVGYRVEQKAIESDDTITLDAIREMYRYLPVTGVEVREDAAAD